MTIFSVIGTSEGYRIDNMGPTLSITSSSSQPTNNSVVPLTFTFSETATGFDVSDLTLVSGTGSFSNFSGSGNTYTADLTLSSTGAFQVSVADAAAADQLGNLGTGATFSGTRDVTAPSAVISAIPTEVNGPFNVTVTFNEDMTGFALGDFTVVNGTASNLQTVSAQVYSATITPDADGTVSVSVAASAATDAAGNGNTVSNTVSTTADVTRPTVTLDVPTGPVNAPFTLTMTLSEQVSAIALGNISVSNGAASNLQQTSTTTFTATITPTADGTVTVNFPANLVTDLAGLGNEAATAATITADLTAPTPTVSLTANAPGDPYTATISFDEDVTGFALDDITVTNGVASNLQTVSARLYSASITPSADGTMTVSVAAGVASDAAGNSNIASNTASTTADVTRPTVTLAMPSGLVNAAFTLTMTFSEEVAGLELGDISVTNGTASDLQQTSATLYTATITPTADGAVTVNFAENVVTDLAGLGNTAATAVTNTADLTAPTPTVSLTANAPGDPYTATISFDEDVTGFALGDITVTNGVASNLQTVSARLYSASITPSADGMMTVSVGAAVASDAAGNESIASNTASTTADVTRPTVTLDMPSGLVNAAFTLTMTFSEEVAGLELGDISVTNGTASDLQQTSATLYTATITPTADGAVTVNFAENVVTDLAGLGNTAATAVTNTADLTAPTPTLTATPGFPGTPYTVTISFDEDVTGLALGDFATTNVDLSNLSGTGDSYTLQATGTDFAQSVQLLAGTVLDAAGNGNLASNTIVVVPDGSTPGLTIAGVPDRITRGQTFDVTFTFSETVIGFEASDISLTNASMGTLRGSGAVYSATLTPNDRGNVTVAVADGAARDITGEPSVGATAVAQLDTSAEQSEAVAHFLQGRARSLIQNQPDVARFVTGEHSGSASVSVTRAGGNFTLSSRGNGPLWLAVSGSWSESDSEELRYGLASLGYHRQLSSGAIVGAMLQYDFAQQEDARGTTVEGTGWLVGPYFAAQIGDHPFFVDGRLLFGQTDNDITLSTGQSGRFSGDRLLATLGAQGRIATERGWTLIPNLTLSHVSDAQNAYVSAGTVVPEQRVTLTELALGMDFEVPILVSQGDLLLDFGVSGIYSRTEGSGAASAYITQEEGHRLRLDFGLSYDNGQGLRSSGAAFVEGLGRDADVSGYGLSFEVALTF
ncbi:Ig-like domain-containing protein [Pararhodobacter zhoushanensis]|uniref:Ig-like domain-containing protein n=1 Tax=Pararhodobacter zhoushanensis TaxID=2479545 RepID=UPI000F8CA6D5|nr:Ig-like domain-containing protein [Pararhodobacter zhoushanensis]